MPDFTFRFGSFSSTSCQMTANTVAARLFLAEVLDAGVIGATFPKTKGEDFRAFIARKGFTWEAV